MGDWNVIEDNDELKKEFEGYKDGLVRYGTEGWEQNQFQFQTKIRTERKGQTLIFWSWCKDNLSTIN